ncbi:DNA-binding transcription factor [Lithospermum erythrorhizon]|uniref:DNA-binding transcription factor n=1 Tax=Lithospermum erythrorhizon TaxID=34254 RepID=A0AAV3R5H3_LITER
MEDQIGKYVEEKELYPQSKKKQRIIENSNIFILGNQYQEHMIQTMLGSSSNDGSISRIAQDHIFSILLLLPIQSILSFAMSCKKFQSLANSDPLWEAICRREWGHNSVDALKTNQYKHKVSWKKLYQQAYQMDTVYCHRILKEFDCGDVLPSPRASHSLNYVSGCLVLFGGGCEGGRHLDDTWVAYIGNDFKKMLKWQKIDADIPTGRFGHSCVVIDDSLILFGGINDKGIRQNDTWVGEIQMQDRSGISLSWRLLDVGSNAPPTRGAHAACCIDSRRMLIHGGIGLSGLRLGDTWILNLSENLNFGSWQEIMTNSSPSSRSGHTLTHLGGTQTVLFGGRGMGYQVLSDVWLFDTSEDHWRWMHLSFEPRNVPHGFSLPRVGHSTTLVLGGRLLIYGGEDAYRNRKDDFWVLDISSLPSSTMQPFTLKQKEEFDKMWRRLKIQGDKPNCRSFHRDCVDQSGCYLYLFGGMVDGLLQRAESSGLQFDGGLFLVELLHS